MNSASALIQAEWPTAAQVQAFSTTRNGGISQAPFNSFNLGDHVGDDPAAVATNRKRLQHLGQLPAPPLWLTQVHGIRVVDSRQWQPGIEADAIYTDEPNRVCAVMTADCLPLLLCDTAGEQVAAVHAGWRGLLHGVIENTVQRFRGETRDILAWLGPAIGPARFEVGPEVSDAFIARDSAAASAFQPADNGCYLADIYQLARQRLQAMGIERISGGGCCTVSESERFFSYRRDGQTGRMASIIWISAK